MTAKTSTTIYLNAELINIAKESGLNISKTCENALKLAINRLQGLNSKTTDAPPQFGANFMLVDRAGFEPAASALRTRRSYQADLPALKALSEKRPQRKHLELSVNQGRSLLFAVPYLKRGGDSHSEH